MFYNITDREGSVTISVFFEDGDVRVVAKTSASFQPLLNYLVTNDIHDEDEVRRLVDPAIFIGTEMREIAGDRVTYDLRNLYFDGRPLHNVIAEHIKAKIQAGDSDWKRLVRFMINLDNNPSRNAQAATYAWVERHGLTITEDGCFLGYKAVLNDHTSSSTGPDNYINGQYYGEPGIAYHVPHNVGDVISKKRADVDDTPGGGCSVGLHVGTYAYAMNFAPVLMTVKVNPEHVVSADQYDHNVKIRVCQYEVVALNEEKEEFIGTVTSRDFGTPDSHGSADEAVPGWRVVEQDNLGITVLESFYTKEAAFEALLGYQDDEGNVDYLVMDPEGTTGMYPADFEEIEPQNDGVSAEEFEEALSGPVDIQERQTASQALTLAENAAILPDLAIDLADVEIGHKALARKWSHLTTESSVRRYRKAHGIKPQSALKKILG